MKERFFCCSEDSKFRTQMPLKHEYFLKLTMFLRLEMNTILFCQNVPLLISVTHLEMWLFTQHRLLSLSTQTSVTFIFGRSCRGVVRGFWLLKVTLPSEQRQERWGRYLEIQTNSNCRHLLLSFAPLCQDFFPFLMILICHSCFSKVSSGHRIILFFSKFVFEI